jgi:hypothetical protein
MVGSALWPLWKCTLHTFLTLRHFLDLCITSGRRPLCRPFFLFLSKSSESDCGLVRGIQELCIYAT